MDKRTRQRDEERQEEGFSHYWSGAANGTTSPSDRHLSQKPELDLGAGTGRSPQVIGLTTGHSHTSYSDSHPPESGRLALAQPCEPKAAPPTSDATVLAPPDLSSIATASSLPVEVYSPVSHQGKESSQLEGDNHAPDCLGDRPGEAAQTGENEGEWEYKIIRTRRNLLANPAVLHRLCQEEAKAGWVLLEKFDDRRVRFKRPVSARVEIDPNSLPFDPYRSTYNIRFNPMRVAIALAIIGAFLIPGYLGYAWVSVQLLSPWRESLPLPILPDPELDDR